MKKKLLVGLCVVFAVIIVAVGAGIYIASTKITPEEVKKVTLTELSKVFPNAEIKLGKLDIGFGLYANLELEKLEMKIAKAGRKANLLTVNNMSAKIPLWAIIFGSGKAEVNLDSPKLYYYQYSKKLDNWTYALGDKKTVSAEEVKTKKVVSKKSKEKSGELALPGFLSVLKLNFDLKNLELHYSLHNSHKRSEGKVIVSIFKIKDLNFNKETVVQIASNIDIQEVGSLDVSVIGELYLNKFVKENRLPVKTEILLKNAKLAVLKKTLPEIKTSLDLEVLKDGSINGMVKTELGSMDLLSANYLVNKKEIKVSDISIKVKIKEITDIVDFENPMLDLGSALFSLKGGTTLNNKNGQIDLGLNFEMNPGIKFNYEGINGSSTLSGSYKKNQINVNSTTKVLDGSANVLLSAFFDPNIKNFNLKKLKPFDLNLTLNNMKVTRKLVSGILYKASDKKQVESQEIKGVKAVAKTKTKPAPIILPPGNITLGINQIKIGADQLSGKGRIKISSNKIETQRFGIKLGEGKLNLIHSTNVKKGNVLDNSFNLRTKNINFESFSTFLPPSVDKMKGFVDMTASGKAKIVPNQDPGYSVKMNLNARDGEIKGLNLKSYVEGFVKNLAMLKQHANKSIDLDDSFEKFNLSGTFSNSKYHLRNFYFLGVKKKIEIKGNGSIYPPPLKKEGRIDLTLKEKMGLTSGKPIPVRLKGEGFILKPDYVYTAQKLYKKKAVKKVKKEGKKLLKKLFKGKKNPLKGLFGG